MNFQFFVLVMFVVVASPCQCVRLKHIRPSFNVLDYGAVGNGKNDETRVCFLVTLWSYIMRLIWNVC